MSNKGSTKKIFFKFHYKIKNKNGLKKTNKYLVAVQMNSKLVVQLSYYALFSSSYVLESFFSSVFFPLFKKLTKQHHM